VPQFWQQIEGTYGEEYFRKWIEDFKNYESLMDYEEQGEEGKGDKIQ
jgi:hypothetical protein